MLTADKTCEPSSRSQRLWTWPMQGRAMSVTDFSENNITPLLIFAETFLSPRPDHRTSMQGAEEGTSNPHKSGSDMHVFLR